MEYVKLGDVCSVITDGSHCSPADCKKGFPMLSVKDMQFNDFSFDNCKHISDESYKQLVRNGCKPKVGDVLLAKDGSFFKYAFVVKEEREIVLLSSIAILRPIPEVLDAGYLKEFLMAESTYRTVSLNYISGTALKRVILKGIKEIELPLPSLAEQRRIAATLDKISGLIEQRRQQLEALDTLVKSQFIEMFGDCKANPKKWDTLPLEEISVVSSSKRVFVEELKDSGVPFYRGTEIGALAEGRTVTPELFITENHYKDLCNASGAPEIGDLLMPSICSDGRIWMVNTELPFYFKDGRVLWVHHISKNFNPVFVLYSLKDRIMSDYGSIASGTTFAELKIFALKKCRIFNVPIELQNRYANFVAQITKSKLAIQQSLDTLETLKKSLMQKYFG